MITSRTACNGNERYRHFAPGMNIFNRVEAIFSTVEVTKRLLDIFHAG